MDNLPTQENEQEAFERFLLRLDPDRERAGERYLELHCALTAFFEHRGGSSPADLSDRAFDRVMKKMSEGMQIAHIPSFLFGVARHVLQEDLRRREIPLETSMPDIDCSSNPEKLQREHESEQQEEVRLNCQKKCLQELPAGDYRLICQYFAVEDGKNKERRKDLAGSFGITLNALRIRVYKINAQLLKCLNDCLSKMTGEINPSFRQLEYEYERYHRRLRR